MWHWDHHNILCLFLVSLLLRSSRLERLTSLSSSIWISSYLAMWTVSRLHLSGGFGTRNFLFQFCHYFYSWLTFVLSLICWFLPNLVCMLQMVQGKQFSIWSVTDFQGRRFLGFFTVTFDFFIIGDFFTIVDMNGFLPLPLSISWWCYFAALCSFLFRIHARLLGQSSAIAARIAFESISIHWCHSSQGSQF